MDPASEYPSYEPIMVRGVSEDSVEAFRRRVRGMDAEERGMFGEELCTDGLMTGACDAKSEGSGVPESGWKQQLEEFLEHPTTHLVIMSLVLADLFLIACEIAISIADPHHEEIPAWVGHVFDALGHYILYFFMFESLIHLVASGPIKFFSSKTQAFDFAVVLISFSLNFFATDWVQFLLVTRLWRIVRVMDSVALAATLKARHKFKLQAEELNQSIRLWQERYLNEREKKLIAIKVGQKLLCANCLEAIPR